MKEMFVCGSSMNVSAEKFGNALEQAFPNGIKWLNGSNCRKQPRSKPEGIAVLCSQTASFCQSNTAYNRISAKFPG